MKIWEPLSYLLFYVSKLACEPGLLWAEDDKRQQKTSQGLNLAPGQNQSWFDDLEVLLCGWQIWLKKILLKNSMA